jgi:hypothetical protein
MIIMMPHSRIQRDMWQARRARIERRFGRHAPGPDGRLPTPALSGIRIRLGHALIGAGHWLSGDSADAQRRSAHHRTA